MTVTQHNATGTFWDGLSVAGGDSKPTVAETSIFYETDTQRLLYFTSGFWQPIATMSHTQLVNVASPNDDHTQYLLVSGTRAMTGNLQMGANDITGVDDIIPTSGVTHDLGDATDFWDNLYVGQALNRITGSLGDMDFHVSDGIGGTNLALFITDGATSVLTIGSLARIDINSSRIVGWATSATANAGAATLPANPEGFVIIRLTGGGADKKIPYYAV